MVENLRKMQELRAQIQAQIKIADTLKKISDNAGEYHHAEKLLVIFSLSISEKNNIDIGMNIADDLEQLKNNLNKYKKSNPGSDLGDVDIQQLDWMEDHKRVKAFIIYESSV